LIRQLSGDMDSRRLSLSSDLLGNMTSDDGGIKLYTIMRALQFRRENPELFRLAPYIPIEVTGDKHDHIVSFARTSPSNRELAIVAAPRFTYTLMKGRIAPPIGEVWGDTELVLPENAPDYLENVFTGEILRLTNRRTLLLRDVFANFPLALLTAR
jgi:(1->4)-alpha-D-glucan 1-alpha-D-glucosylmutase